MQITEQVHGLKIPFTIKISPEIQVERFVNVYLILGEKIVLIDSGVAGSEQVIFDYIKSTGRKPEEISQIILTHSHPDHIGACRVIQEETGCSIAAHAGEKNWIEDVDLQFRERPVPGFHDLVGGPVKVDSILVDGDILKLEDSMIVNVYHTPGHSKGSISLLLQPGNSLFSGDAVPISGDLPIYDNVQALVESIKKLQNIKNIKYLLSAWDEPRRENLAYGQMDNSLWFIQKLHDTVFKVAGESGSQDPVETGKRVLVELGLPQSIINPLFVRSVQANLAARSIKDLLA